MKVVLDTNVVISALLHPARSCGQILNQILDGHIVWLITLPVLSEYKEVCLRPELSISDVHREWLLEAWANLPLLSTPPYNCSSVKCSDIEDQKFLDAAIYYQASLLITGNIKHYPKKNVMGVRIIKANKWKESFRIIDAEGR